MLNKQQIVCDESLRWWADNSRDREIRWIAQELIELRAAVLEQQAGAVLDVIRTGFWDAKVLPLAVFNAVNDAVLARQAGALTDAVALAEAAKVLIEYETPFCLDVPSAARWESVRKLSHAILAQRTPEPAPAPCGCSQWGNCDKHAPPAPQSTSALDNLFDSWALANFNQLRECPGDDKMLTRQELARSAVAAGWTAALAEKEGK